MKTTADIRQSFIDFFAARGHRIVPSSPVIPHNDPTLLFTNAGMNQFKDIFTGKSKADFPRAVSSQKCIRAGGKHNDLDNVGFTARHHTFFEMLGNFSFGDYFKEEAIVYAWEWVTKELGLPKDKLYASVYETDDEAFELWAKIAPELKNGRILRFGKKDNYWTMGDVGPCGPCSEIHIDRGEKYGTGKQDVVNGETDRFMEIWNLVFMQFEQLPDGSVVPLPKPSVDTGAGLERIASVIQHVDTNFGIDIFQKIIADIATHSKVDYKKNQPSYHVIADHLRALSFAIADGAGISNEGQGYVLRRILRRAARHGRLLGMNDPFMFSLVPTLVNTMGAAYPELQEKQRHIQNVIRTEEEAFARTLENGLELFESVKKRAASAGTKVVPGEDVFKLYDTYGFPYDLTEIIAKEAGFSLDQQGFETAMNRQREQSRESSKFSSAKGSGIAQRINDVLREKQPKGSGTEFLRGTSSAKSKATFATTFEIDDNAIGVIIPETTPFYLESGGQISDTGTISGDGWTLNVELLMRHESGIVHAGTVSGNASALDSATGKEVTLTIDADRRNDIMRNHTATHLLHAALRTVLGTHVKQAGSYVGPDRLRFDFSHHAPVSADETKRIEEIVNSEIIKGTPVVTDVMDVESAKKTGAMALFGEKYGDKVRVVSINGFSKELCGGTHVENVGQIGPFVVTVEAGVASGVRRIEAVTGHEGISYLLDAKAFRGRVAEAVGRSQQDALSGVESLRESNQQLQKELKKVRLEMFSHTTSIGTEEKIGSIVLMTHSFGDADKDAMSAWVDSLREGANPIIVVAHGKVGGKETVMTGVSATASKAAGVDAGKLLGQILPQFGGRGGGKPTYAQGAVADNTDSTQLFAAFKDVLAKNGKG